MIRIVRDMWFAGCGASAAVIAFTLTGSPGLATGYFAGAAMTGALCLTLARGLRRELEAAKEVHDSLRLELLRAWNDIAPLPRTPTLDAARTREDACTSRAQS